MTSTRARIAAVATAGLAAAALAGCAGTSTTGANTPTPTITTTARPTATTTVTPSPTPSASGGTSGSGSSSSGSSGSSGSGSSGSGTSNGGSGGSGSLRAGQCTTPDLAASVTPAPGGGAAGSTGLHIVLTNTGSASCTLQGWAGVSLVGHGDGTQIGAAADFDRSSPHGTVTLQPKGSAYALVTVAEAGNYPQATCQPTATDGFRVYPPGEKRALFAKYSGVTGCANAGTKLLTEKALQPGT